MSREDLQLELERHFIAGVVAGRMSDTPCPSAEMNAIAAECSRVRIKLAAERGITLSAYRDDEVTS